MSTAAVDNMNDGAAEAEVKEVVSWLVDVVCAASSSSEQPQQQEPPSLPAQPPPHKATTISAGNSMEIGLTPYDACLDEQNNNQYGHNYWPLPNPLPIGDKRNSYAGQPNNTQQTVYALSHHPGLGQQAGSAQELRFKLESVQRELTSLMMKNSDMTERYRTNASELSSVVQERDELKAMLDEMQAALMQAQSDADLHAHDKQLLTQQTLDLKNKLETRRVEMADMRERLNNAHGVAYHNDVVSTVWRDNVFKQMEEQRQENELLRQECDVLRDRSRLVDSLQRQLEIEASERRADKERNRMDTMRAYERLNELVQEKEMLKNTAEVSGKRLQECLYELQSLRSSEQRYKEQQRLADARFSQVHQEYTNIMSERDVVLRENDELASQRDLLQERIKKLERDRQETDKQTEQMRQQMIDMQQQLWQDAHDDTRSSVLHGGVTASSTQLSLASSESEVAEITRLAIEKELQQSRLQMDEMRRQIDANREEVAEARGYRDWAFAERQRIVSERESMRAMCDQLRKERDDAITKLADAIKDTDDLQRQRDLVKRQLIDAKAKHELDLAQLTTATLNCQRNVSVSPSHSRDSAIDSDMAEWEVETLELSMNASKSDSCALGVDLLGGKDEMLSGMSVPVYVKSVTPGSRFEGVLRTFDCILQVNDIDVGNMERRSVVDILHNSKNVKMVVKRRRLLGMKLLTVPLTAADADAGLQFDDGVYISKIKASSAAARAGNLAVGDRVIYVNGIPVADKSAAEINALVQSVCSRGCVFVVMKSPPLLSPITPTVSFNQGFADAAAASTPLAKQHNTQQQQQHVHCQTGSSEAGSWTASDSQLQTGGSSGKSTKPTLLGQAKRLLGRQDKDKKRSAVVASAHLNGSSSGGEHSRGSSSQRVKLRHQHNQAAHIWGTGPRMRADEISLLNKRNGAQRNTVIGQSSLEQQVMQHLDDVIEQADMPHSSATGSTWPKYHNVSMSSPTETLNGDGTLTAGDECKLSGKKAHARAPVFGVFDRGEQQSPTTSAFSSSRPTTASTPVSNIRVLEQPQQNSRPASASQQQQQQQQQQQPPPPAYDRVLQRTPSDQHYGMPKPQPIRPNEMCCNTRSVGSSSGRPTQQQQQQPPPYNHGGRHEDYQSMTSHSSLSIPSARGTPVHRKGAPRHSPFQQINSDDSQSTASSSHVRLNPGDRRTIHIEKSSSRELGIGVDSPSGHGVFINKVNDASLAARQGVTVGDQLLDICGISMVGADLDSAKKVLGQMKGLESVSMTVQYNPVWLLDSGHSWSGSMPRYSPATYLSNSLTRQSSVHSSAHSRELLGIISERGEAAAGQQRAMMMGSSSSSSKAPHQPQQQQSGRSTALSVASSTPLQQRLVNVRRRAEQGGSAANEFDCWGCNIRGGNATGIFVDKVAHDMPPDSLQVGQRILEFNGIDMRRLTLEQAKFELQRKSDPLVQALVEFDQKGYENCKRARACDDFYVRVNVDRPAETSDDLELKAGNIVYVDCTLFNDKPGRWRAWLTDKEGRQRSCGIIPSKYKLEEDLIMKRSLESSGGNGASSSSAAGIMDALESLSSSSGSRRGTIRRSLKFIRRSSRSSQHNRTSSKDDTDSLTLIDDVYQRVQKHDYSRKRPILLLGALHSQLVGRLVQQLPHVFVHCVPECVHINQTALEQGMANLLYIDFRKRQQLFEVTSAAVVKEYIDKGLHCILDVSLAALERLQQLQIYPIVVLVKFKSAKQVCDVFNGMNKPDKLKTADAKHMIEQAAQVEEQLKHINCYYTTVMASTQQQAETTVRMICQHLAAAVEHEQKKTLWVPSSELL